MFLGEKMNSSAGHSAMIMNEGNADFQGLSVMRERYCLMKQSGETSHAW